MLPTQGLAGPIFVVGYSRSGTKFVCNLLQSASGGRVVAVGELHFLGRLATTGHESLGTGDLERIREALAAQYLRKKGCPYADTASLVAACERHEPSTALRTRFDVYRHFLEAVAVDQGAAAACDGTPRNAYYIGELLAEFAAARVIYMLRDPRDAILSQKNKAAQVAARGDRQEASRLAVNYNPVLMARFWDRSARNFDRFAHDPRVTCVRYEDLLADPARVLAALGGFLGIRGLERHIDTVQRSNAGKWKSGLTSGEIAAIEFTVRGALRDRGYAATKSTVVGLVSALWWGARFVVRFPFVYAANSKRFSALGHEFRKRILGAKGP
jgi:hypothetical protein